MDTRTSRSKITFTHPFSIRGYEESFPAGTYDVIVEEERLRGFSFDAWRQTSTHLMIARRADLIEMRPVEPQDLDDAIGRDRANASLETGAAAPHAVEGER